MASARYTNPVYPHYFADPFVWRCGSEFYAIGTGPSEAGALEAAQSGQSIRAPESMVFPLLRSNDLVKWRDAGRALVRPDASFGDTFWAPEVVFADGRWLLYYSVGFEDRLHQIRVASSADPLGPYIDCATLTDPSECPFAIDPHPFRDDDGRWYLFHARDFLDCQDQADASIRAGTAIVVHPLETMTKLSPHGSIVARARWDWQRFAENRMMYDRVFDWHTLEGPFVVRRDRRYYCFYSAGCWQNETYGVDYVIADSVMGPWRDDSGGEGPRVLRSVPGRVLGPGHCSITTAPGNADPVLVYHAWGAGMKARRMCIDPLRFTPDGPRSPGPTWTAQELPERAA
jgi:GH43 family beta-xylosidase